MKFIKLCVMLLLLSVMVGSLFLLNPTAVEAEVQAQTCSSRNGLHFRNSTSNPIWVAVNFYDGGLDEYVSVGWWYIRPNQTRTVISGPLNDVAYYYNANDTGSREWGGSSDGWVEYGVASFVIPDDISFSYASSQGYRQPGFGQIYVGGCFGYTANLIRR